MSDEDQFSFPWSAVTAADFAELDIYSPLTDISAADIAGAFKAFNEAANKANTTSATRAYSLLAAVCSFHFDPTNPAAAFTPFAQLEGRRTSQPSDYIGQPSIVLGQLLPLIGHLGVRTRVADTLWQLNRKDVEAGRIAILGYTEIAGEIPTASKLGPDLRPKDWSQIPKLLRRAFQIGKSVGWNRNDVKASKQTLSDLCESAASTEDAGTFLKLASLALDYKISEPLDLAEMAEMLVPSANLAEQLNLNRLAARAFQFAKRPADAERCRVACAEVLAAQADSQSSAMAKSHWLEQAVLELRGLPVAGNRYNSLKAQLAEQQQKISDELKYISHSEDISDLVKEAVGRVRGKTLYSALKQLATLTQSPNPEDLRRDALEQISEFPLSNLFGSTKLDATGKPVHRTYGTSDSITPDEAIILSRVSESEKLRRSFVVAGAISPTRRVIVDEHGLDSSVASWICQCSPFVPPASHGLFSYGLTRFFHGDYVAAVHVLIPQIENSIRHVLRMRGEDVVKINSDGTQEDMSLTQMLTRKRLAMNSAFGEPLVSDFDHLLIYRGGPQLRDRISHGLITQFEPFSDDSIYACWLALHICCLPLLADWEGFARGYSD